MYRAVSYDLMGAAILTAPSGTVVDHLVMGPTCASCTNLLNYTGYAAGLKVATTGTYNILLQQVSQTRGPNDYGPSPNSIAWKITSP